AIKVQGRVRVRDTREGPSSASLLVLCESRQAIDHMRLPPEVSPGEKKEPWTIIAVQPRETEHDNSSEGFTERLIIPGAWEQRLRQKLSVRGDVFSTNEWDVGLAKGVEHQIRLQDNKPFRERSRRIAPADIEDYTTPRIDDALDCLVGSKWFSILDLRSGYYQMAMAEDDKEKTAF
ncbi:hypothetical protein QTP86_004944, partial [Hemibagrus guttatus]